MFWGYCIVYFIVCGFSMGGLCYKVGMSVYECEVFVVIMIFKVVVVDLFFGGVKGGVDVDLVIFSVYEFEGLIWCYIFEFVELIGKNEDIFVFDVGID